MPESGNLFLSIFFGIFFPGPSMNGIQDKIFFRSFSTNLIPFSLKILPERGFLIYWFFFYFFRNFLTRVVYERNSGLNFFSTFLGLSHPVLAKNNARKRFFSFFEFFSFFFLNFLSRVEYDRNSGLKFFTLFLGLFQPVLDRNNAGINFFIFLYFFAIFFGIFLLGSSMNGIWE